MARKRKAPARRKRGAFRTSLARLAVVVGATIVGLVALFVLTCHLYRIPASSMEPTFHCAKPGVGCLGEHEDRIVVPRFLFRHPDRGDVIAFKTPPLARVRCGAGGTYVKRVVGLPGETIGERNGRLFVDGKPLREPYIGARWRDEQTYAPRRVPDDAYFVVGDNRAQSCDSRVWGAVPKANVVGRVVFTYWPPTRIGFR